MRFPSVPPSARASISHLLPVLGLLSLLAAACSGGREDNLRTSCGAGGECPSGMQCQGGYCEADSPVVGGGDVEVSAAARAEGVDAVVDVRVEGGGTCKDSSCTVKQGATVTFTAPSVTGYRFAGWSGDPNCVGSELVLVLRNVDDDIMCIANYVQRLFVRGEVDGQGAVVGAESSAPLASCSGPQCEVDRGATVVLTAPERAGYRFSGWSGDGCELTSGVQVTVTVDKADVVCTALYVPGFVVRGSAEGAVAVVSVASSSATAVCATSSCQVDAGSPVSLSAPDVAGFRFTGFSGAAACVTSEPTINIASADADIECVAHYVRRFRVTGGAQGASPSPALQASSLDTFATCQSDACLVDQGGSATLLAPTVNGFRLRGWLGADCAGQTSSSVTFAQVDHDIECTAEYVRGVGVNGTAVGATAAVTASSSSDGAVCAGSSCALDVGGTVTLSVAAVTGFTFTGWTGDAGCQSSAPSFTLANIDGSKTCVANFSRVRFTVGAAVAPAASGVVASQSNSSTAVCSATGCSVDYGANVTLTATPNTGYDFVGWSGCSALTTATVTLNNVTANASCTATFSLRQLTVSTAVAPATSGSVDTPCGAASCQVPYGGSLQITALESNPAYRFSAWSGCSTSTAPVLDVSNVTTSRSCTANFVLRSYTLTANVAPAGSGMIIAPCGGASCTVPVTHGTQPMVSATPATGFYFTGWSGCSTAATTTTTVPAVTGPVTCTANFARQPRVTALVSPVGVATVNPCFAAACAVNPGGSVTLTPTISDANYRFNGWNCTGAVNQTNNALTLTGINADLTCTASFVRPRFTVTSTVTPNARAGSVTTSCNATLCTVNAGDSVTLTATPSGSAFRFANWTGCVNSTARTIVRSNVQNDQTCTANFVTNAAPIVTATIPPRASAFTLDPVRQLYYATVTLSGSATDAEDGPLGGGSLVWSTSQTAVQTGQLGTGGTITVRLYHAGGCALYNHTVTLTATDSNGRSASQSANVSLDPGCIL